MEPDPSNWSDATKIVPVHVCEKCGEERQVDFQAGVFYCNTCSHSWRPPLNIHEELD